MHPILKRQLTKKQLAREKLTPDGTAPELSKDELNLAEYPLGFLSDRAPSGVTTVEYNGWTFLNGRREPVRWTLEGSQKHGLPTGADQDILVALLKLAHEQRFKTPTISLGSAYAFVKCLGWGDRGQSYRRLKQGLRRWHGLSVETENAFWDKSGGRFLRTKGFHILNIDILERYGGLDKKSTLLPIFTEIEFDPFFWRSIKAGNIKDLNLWIYRQLPTPVARKLFRYLDKKRWHGRHFSINIYKLSTKLGLAPAGLKLYKRVEKPGGATELVEVPVTRYKPNRLKKLLTPALEALKEVGFLTYTFEEGKGEPQLKVLFAASENAGELRLPQSGDPALAAVADRINKARNTRRQQVIQDMIAVTQDDGHSRRYFTKLANELEEQVIYELISEVQKAQQRNPRTNPAKLFTHLAQERRRQPGG